MTTELGTYLRTQRVAHGITQSGLAREIGSDVATISRWETGKARPSQLRHTTQLMKVLRLDPAELQRLLAQPAVPVVPLPTLEDVVRADDTLLPEAKRHLLAQYRLLQRVQGPDAPARQRRELERDAEAIADEVVRPRRRRKSP